MHRFARLSFVQNCNWPRNQLTILLLSISENLNHGPKQILCHMLWCLSSVSHGWLWFSFAVFLLWVAPPFVIVRYNSCICTFQDLDGNHGKNAGSSSHERH
jgi:hypothetical protein